mgnify:CR=1 FL=1
MTYIDGRGFREVRLDILRTLADIGKKQGATVRNIVVDLQERLAEARRHINNWQHTERLLLELLKAEETQFGATQEGPTPDDGDAVRQFVLETLQDGRGYLVEGFKQEADRVGFKFPSPNPGRSLNMTLVNLMRAKRVYKDTKGFWFLGQPEEQEEAEKEAPEAPAPRYVEDDIPF